MKILRIIASIDPATGGPVAGLRAITPALAALGHTSEFLTVDSPNADYLESFVAPVHAMGPARHGYSYTPRVARWLAQHAREFDALIVHGLWQHLGPATRKASARAGAPPYFIFPHGMLDPTLKQTYPLKHIKKWWYWLFVERTVVAHARAIFFTCEEERRLARTTFPLYKATERVVAYGTAMPEGKPEAWRRSWRDRVPALTDKPYWIFLGRIHSKKGVDLLLRAYGKIFSQLPETKRATLPELVLAGPCLDPGYLHSLQAIAQDFGCTEKVHWTGMLTGEAKWGALHEAEAFVLPSYQENFGIAVVEALACGTPVLLSNRVNIWREIAAAHAAMVEPATEEGTMVLLQKWMERDDSARQSMRVAARECFRQHFEVARAARSLADELSALVR